MCLTSLVIATVTALRSNLTPETGGSSEAGVECDTVAISSPTLDHTNEFVEYFMYYTVFKYPTGL